MTHPDIVLLVDPLFAFGAKRVVGGLTSLPLAEERVVERSKDRVSQLTDYFSLSTNSIPHLEHTPGLSEPTPLSIVQKYLYCLVSFFSSEWHAPKLNAHAIKAIVSFNFILLVL